MSSQRGNVLFLILIAVALFAALSYAVTSSTRSGTGDTSAEANKLAAARILNFANNVGVAVNRIMLTNNVDIHQIIYTTPVYTFTNGNIKVTSPSQASNPSLALFNAAGGGIAPELFHDLRDKSITYTPSSTVTSPGHVGFVWRSIPQMGTTAAEAAVSVIGITPEICLELNKAAGMDSIPAMTGSGASMDIPGTSGNPGNMPFSMSSADMTMIRGKHDICYRLLGADGRHAYIHVLKVY